jgi:hypothetical protein
LFTETSAVVFGGMIQSKDYSTLKGILSQLIFGDLENHHIKHHAIVLEVGQMI